MSNEQEEIAKTKTWCQKEKQRQLSGIISATRRMILTKHMFCVNSALHLLPREVTQLCLKIYIDTRGGEKNRLTINHDYNIDNYESIIKFRKIDFPPKKYIYLFIYFYLFIYLFKLQYKRESSSYWLPLHGPQFGAKICYSIPELFHI